jgi:rod shape-determining protein MreC
MWGEPRTRSRDVTISVLLVASLLTSFIDHPVLSSLSASVASTARPLEQSAWRLSRRAGLLPTLLRQRADPAEENRRLRQRLAELEDRLVVLTDELAQTRRELSAAAQLPPSPDPSNPRPLLSDVVGVAAEVVGLGADGWRQLCRVNRGSHDGAAVGQPVVWGLALVGVVEAVSPWGAEVRLTTDPKSRLWCADARSGAEAVAVGAGRDQLRLPHVSWPADIEPGDAFLTTGKAGRYPRGLVVGVVQEARCSADGLTADVLLRPRLPVRECRTLFLLTWSPVAQPTDRADRSR